ncbi:MAG: hypothetical protein ACE5WD_00320 [Candidatus Aminicenantia bacterium]
MEYLEYSAFRKQIEAAMKRAKCKKVLYFYDNLGYKRLLGVFNKKTAYQIRRYLRTKKLVDRMTEFDIKTTEPPKSFLEAIDLITEYSSSRKSGSHSNFHFEKQLINYR